MGAISLGYAQNGEYAKVSVTFSYRKWTRKVSTIESAGGFRDISDFESEIYGPGSALTFKNYQLKKIDKPSKELIELCKCVFN